MNNRQYDAAYRNTLKSRISKADDTTSARLLEMFESHKIELKQNNNGFFIDLNALSDALISEIVKILEMQDKAAPFLIFNYKKYDTDKEEAINAKIKRISRYF